MRSLLLCSIVAALAFGLTAPASAGHAMMRTAATYSACHCHFGYLADKSACTPAATCLTEGGRCRSSCGMISEPNQ